MSNLSNIIERYDLRERSDYDHVVHMGVMSVASDAVRDGSLAPRDALALLNDSAAALRMASTQEEKDDYYVVGLDDLARTFTAIEGDNLTQDTINLKALSNRLSLAKTIDMLEEEGGNEDKIAQLQEIADRYDLVMGGK